MHPITSVDSLSLLHAARTSESTVFGSGGRGTTCEVAEWPLWARKQRESKTANAMEIVSPTISKTLSFQHIIPRKKSSRDISHAFFGTPLPTFSVRLQPISIPSVDICSAQQSQAD